MILGSMVGCVTIPKNIANNALYPTDYVVGNVYRLKQLVVAEKADLTIFGTYSHLSLDILKKGSRYNPADAEDFEKNKKRWPFIAGVAKPGTLIRITKIQLENSFEMGPIIFVTARILDVPWAKKTAELLFISKRDPTPNYGPDLPMVDPEILELVPNP